jgi:hypothetical protein
MRIETVRDFLECLREGAYTSVGSYPKFFLTDDGGALSFKTAREEVWQIARAIRDVERNGWRVVACDVNWEDPELFDDHSGERIQSAYAEDEAQQNACAAADENCS